MEKQSTKKLIALCGALVMFSFNVANAQIISTDVNPDITQSCTIALNINSYKSDLNNGGIKDFGLDAPISEPNSNNTRNQSEFGGNHEILESENFTPNTNFTVNPNPFSDATNITFTLNQSEKVSMWIIDLKGVLIKSMLNSDLEAGDYLIQCNSENLKAGIYFLQIKAGETLTTEKLIVTK